MKRPLTLVALAAIAALSLSRQAAAQSEYDGLISSQAQANGVPEALVHRVIQRESRYRAGATGRCGCIGLMQVKGKSDDRRLTGAMLSCPAEP